MWLFLGMYRSPMRLRQEIEIVHVCNYHQFNLISWNIWPTQLCLKNTQRKLLSIMLDILQYHTCLNANGLVHGLRTPGEEIVFTVRPKIKSQILRYSRSIFCLKSVHFKRRVAQSSFLSKVLSSLLKSKQSQRKWQHFWKKWGSRNCLLKMNGL